MKFDVRHDGADSRRSFLAGLAALGAGAVLPGCQTAGGGAAGGKPHRIDVHHHIASPGYSAALKSMMRGHAKWSPQASLGRDYPGRFGSFASIPFPDIEGSLREIEYALDTLKADGIYLWTSYGGKLLGDPDFFPILEEFNRRKVVVYTHPATPACCAKIMPYISINAIEGPVDTTRTMVSLIFQGGAARFPDIRWIFSHSGGVTPFLLSRFQREEAALKDKSRLPNGLMHELRKFYYDTAQGNHEGALQALLAIIPPSQVLYGTDFPFRDGAEVIGGLAKHGFGAADRRAIDRDNALRLFPRLRA
ncbi:MAG: amidohydrolase [Betaproteobacteria bacterium]|nr:amidohydrolase [Betaproteobacteria bacterium]